MLLGTVTDRRSEYGAKIRAFRTQRRLSQEKLAELAGLSRQAISEIERGVTWPENNTRTALATALGMPAEHEKEESPLRRLIDLLPTLSDSELRRIVDRISEERRVAKGDSSDPSGEPK